MFYFTRDMLKHKENYNKVDDLLNQEQYDIVAPGEFEARDKNIRAKLTEWDEPELLKMYESGELG